MNGYECTVESFSINGNTHILAVTEKKKVQKSNGLIASELGSYCRDLNTYNKIQGKLNIENSSLLDEEIKRYLDYDCKELPTGIIHSDLFRDNVMFQENTLTGVLDFYYACNGYFIYDLAITVNHSCTNSSYKIDNDKQKSLIGAYEQVRSLQDIEKKEWNMMLRFASLRFWLSRLNDQLFPTDGDLTTVLDPDHFKNILKDRINYSDKLE